MLWECFGSASGVRRECVGSALGMCWECFGSAFGVLGASANEIEGICATPLRKKLQFSLQDEKYVG